MPRRASEPVKNGGIVDQNLLAYFCLRYALPEKIDQNVFAGDRFIRVADVRPIASPDHSLRIG